MDNKSVRLPHVASQCFWWSWHDIPRVFVTKVPNNLHLRLLRIFFTAVVSPWGINSFLAALDTVHVLLEYPALCLTSISYFILVLVYVRHKVYLFGAFDWLWRVILSGDGLGVVLLRSCIPNISLIEPRVLKCLSYCDALASLFVEHLLNDINASRWTGPIYKSCARKVGRLLLDQLECQLAVIGLKWKLLANHAI